MMAVPPVVTLVMGLWGLTARPYWGDEIDTLSAVSRSLPQLARLLGHVDAVHGLYLLMLWPVVHVAGSSPFVTRLPSVLAMAAAAAGVTVIGRRLRSLRAGVYAGLVFAILPTVTDQAHDARPYAMVAAAAVLASYLLVRAMAEPRPAWFAGYALALVLLGYLELFALLLVPAHAITLLALRREPGATRRLVTRRWLLAVAATGAAMVPVVIGTWREHNAYDWIQRPGWSDIKFLVSWLAAGTLLSALLIAVLAVYGGRHMDQLTWLALPWLVLPPVALIAMSQIHPVYSFRYIVFCVPAVALLAGAGLAAMRWVLPVAALVLLALLAKPAQLARRVPGGGGGGPLQAAAGVMARNERPGDALIYPGSPIPPWNLAYPRAFGTLRDLSVAQSAATLGHLYASTVRIPVLLRRERGISRIWVVQTGPSYSDPGPYIASGFQLAGTWQFGSDQARLALYQRTSPPR